MLLNNRDIHRMFNAMKHILLSLVASMALTAGATSAQAACYADYKAKRDNPLELHYGVMQVSSCSASEATPEINARLAGQGWKLLKVLSTFDDSGLNEKRKQRAGQYYLRF